MSKHEWIVEVNLIIIPETGKSIACLSSVQSFIVMNINEELLRFYEINILLWANLK